VTTFATPDEVSIYLGRGPLPRGDGVSNQAELEQWALLIELVSADVQIAAGREILAGTGTHLLAGTWGSDLVLPQTPVTSVTSVSVNGVALGSGDYAWNSRALLRRGGTFDEAGADPGSATWGGPSSTISVTYAWGEEAVPTWAKSVTLRAIARVVGNPSQVTQESLGVYSATYAQVTGDGSHITRAERKYLRRIGGRVAGTLEARS
jgi:hypothetical protein